MPLTPVTWLAETIVNLTTSGTQSNPRITHLANGNILVVWDSGDETGAGSPAGFNVIGQLFNPLGARIGGEFQIDGGLDEFAREFDPDVAALPGGGFIAVYLSDTALSTDIVLTIRDATGGNPVSFKLANEDDSLGGPPDYRDPRVTVGSATSVLVTYQELEVGGDSRIVGRIYNPETNTAGPEISLINVPGQNAQPAVATLANGNYVIAAASQDSAVNGFISYRMISQTGLNVLGVTRVASTDGDEALDSDASVTALAGGGFVIAWAEDFTTPPALPNQRVSAQVHDANGVAVGGTIELFTVSGGVDSVQPSVVALADGGFLILGDNSTSLVGRRYDAGGLEVGNQFFFASGIDAGGIDAELLADGRVAISYVTEAGEIGLTILDSRDAANDPGVYSPEDWQIGTIGDDTITADGDVFFVAGHDGDDTITTGGPAASYLGGNGNDRVNVTNPIDNDAHDGGEGIDSIDWSNSGQIGGDFDLAAGTARDASDPGNVLSEAMTGFENLVGTIGGDRITGTDGANTLAGGFGDDTISGGDGEDVIEGGGNNDTLTGGNGQDRLDGGEGDDVIDGGDRDDTISGGGGDDSFTLGLLAGNDAFDGGSGVDTADFSALTDFDLGIDMLAGTWGDLDFVFGVFTAMENVSTSIGNDEVNGNSEANIIIGNAGNDTLVGRGGADELSGGDNDDTLDGGAGVDNLSGGNGDDVLSLGSTGLSAGDAFDGGNDADRLDFAGLTASHIVNLATGVFSLATGDALSSVIGIENVTAGGGSDSLTGNDANNTLIGGAGSDALDGGGGDDRLEGGNGADVFQTAGQNDQSFGGKGNDRFLLNNPDFAGSFSGGGGKKDVIDASALTSFAVTIDLGAGNYVDGGNTFSLVAVENAIGGQLDDAIAGSGGANTLEGRGGNDSLNGGLGADMLLGGSGNDTYFVDQAGDRVFETTEIDGAVDAGGVDTINSAVGFNLGLGSGTAFVERLTLIGANNSNATGNGLDNRLAGNTGDNVLNGGAGSDRLTGGVGADVFLFKSALGTGNRDTITDFSVADDTIRLDDAVFLGLDRGALAGNAFAANARGIATTEDHRLIYETDTGRLFFDADGAGNGGRVMIAILAPGLALSSADFSVI